MPRTPLNLACTTCHGTGRVEERFGEVRCNRCELDTPEVHCGICACSLEHGRDTASVDADGVVVCGRARCAAEYASELAADEKEAA